MVTMEWFNALRYTGKAFREKAEREAIEAKINMKLNGNEIVTTTLNDREIARLYAEKMADTTSGSPEQKERGMLAEGAVEYELIKNRLVHIRHLPVDKDSELREAIGIAFPDFRLKGKDGRERVLEIKSCPEILTKWGDPYKLAQVEGDGLDADYLVAVKILEIQDTEAKTRIWGYMARDQFLALPLIEGNHKLFRKTGTGRAADLTNWDLWHPTKELWEILKDECLTWEPRRA